MRRAENNSRRDRYRGQGQSLVVVILFNRCYYHDLLVLNLLVYHAVFLILDVLQQCPACMYSGVTMV